MIKATRTSVLALAVVALVSGCSKDGGAGGAATKAAADKPATTAAQPTPPHPVPSAVPDDDIDLSGIARAAGGQTVAEVYAGKDQLAGQQVTVRGKVVKANAMVMDRNWLHVRDGSGAEGSNDLTVTTTGELPQAGSTVVVTGALAVNKDFGMGYQYPVIVEDAVVTVE